VKASHGKGEPKLWLSNQSGLYVLGRAFYRTRPRPPVLFWHHQDEIIERSDPFSNCSKFANPGHDLDMKMTNLG